MNLKDEDLKKSTDYSKDMVDAAYCVLGEIANILENYSNDMRIVGGWVPTLLFPECNHIGSIDVDVLFNQNEILENKYYENIKKIFIRNGYKKHPEKFFTFVKTVILNDISYDIDVDLLSGKYGGDSGSFSKHVAGIKTLPATGGNFAFDFPAEKVKIEYIRPDGAKDVCHVMVIAVIPYLVMKTKALGRGKPKDAYDIYFCINNYQGGVENLLKEMLPYKDVKLIKEICEKLSEKFASTEHSGPIDIVKFMDISDEEEIEMIKQDAYQKIMFIVKGLS